MRTLSRLSIAPAEKFNKIVLTSLVSIICLMAGLVDADDTEIFLNAEGVRPNVLFILDVSGSMRSRDRTRSTRLDKLKVALSALLESNDNFNAGLMTYSSYSRGQFSLRDEILPVADSKSSLLSHLKQLYASGGTPTQSALYEGLRYFRGDRPIVMGGLSNVRQPPAYECQSNHVVLLTDGVPSYDYYAWSRIGQYTRSNCAWNRGSNARNGNCGIELAKYMYENDHYPSVDGVNNIAVHTIGLNLNMQWLRDIAAAGGGGSYTVETSDQLQTAFESIVETAFDQATTFVAPSVAVDQFSRLSHRKDTYLALFQPTNTMRWQGNLKRFSFSGSPLSIRDKNNRQVFDSSSGTLSDESHSFWSEDIDGNTVSSGGAASKLDVSERVVTTYSGAGTTDLTDILNRVHESNASNLAQYTGVSGNELTRILSWARGIDVNDENGNGSNTDSRFHMGDPLHSHPAILTYGGTSENPDSLVFVGTNEGYLHAVNSEDGVEQYAFIPPELLANLKIYFDNSAGFVRPYGLDGDITLWFDDKNHNGIVDAEFEHAYLYIGMRRGGNNYYALDVTEKESPKYLWTIKGGPKGSPGFSELGQTWSKPVKSKLRVKGSIKDVLIFGGGYDPAQDHTTIRSVDTIGNAVFIVDALDGSLIWKTSLDGQLEYSQMQYSLPSDPRVIDIDGDSIADQMYIGDMGGQLWRFDFNFDSGSGADLVVGGLVAELASSAESDNRRFFYPPDVTLTSREGSYYLSLAFGSGNRAHPLDSTVEDKFYMIRQDDFDGAPDGYGMIVTEPTTNQPATYRAITEDDLYNVTDNDIVSDDDTITLNAQEALDQSQGWVLNLEEKGEKVLGTSVTIDNNIVFATYIPDASGQPETPCRPAIGGNRAYAVSLYDATSIEGTATTDRYIALEQAGIAGSASAIISEVEPGIEDSPWSVKERLFWSEIPDH